MNENNIVWVDLEMTGLDPNTEHIIEMACIVTDQDLNVLAESPDIVIKQPDEVLDNMDDWCKTHHGESGLTQAVKNSQVSLQECERQMLEFIRSYTVKGKNCLAGNSIHVDKEFLRKYMPTFMERLHYRIIDVSSIKELARRWYPKELAHAPKKALTHRALQDIKESIEELRRASSSSKKSKFVKIEENKGFDVTWKHHGEEIKTLKPLLYLSGPDIKPANKIAAFDLDETLISTISGKTFPTSADDWKFLSPNIVPKLKSLYNGGYKIAIMSNQAGIEKKKAKEEDVRKKIEAIIQQLGFPVQVFISTGENIYRKPCTTMWDFMVADCNSNLSVNLVESFYVGDAAGRPKGWTPGKRKDFSCSDRKFAANVGIRFYTPEEYFDNVPPYTNFDWGSAKPETFLKVDKKHSYDDMQSKGPEMVIFVGFPASGKSTFFRTNFESKNYTRINKDTIKSESKCLQLGKESMKNKASVVIDNTNPSKQTRKPYIQAARNHGVPVRCFYFDVSIELAKHLNMYRQSQTNGKVRRVPDVGYNVFKSKFEEPELSEGLQEIVRVQPRFEFDCEKAKKLFLNWT